MKTKVCKYCEIIYNTEKKYSKVCPKCQEKNHEIKIKRTLNLL